ncbi:G-protein coupled receptor family C group 6 member A-like [Mugil cephalus]|uniref:G-protein coupled receptor family C group 6 member A-like n=1 Tax=Mugil cephalus TaxID=48193 RepID=UPI001FB69B49|nr:G-protein coupled receptor family C group 6 member A-like [Mugil cephalus]
MFFSLWLFISSLGVFHSCFGQNSLHEYSAGDIIIGGLFPIHLQSNRSEGPEVVITCSRFDIQMFLRTHVMIYAITKINQRTPRDLPNITLGYDIYDTCGDVSLAIKAALQLLKNQSDPQSCLLPEMIQSAFAEPETKAVIGERYSEVSIAVARILALSSVPQISFASTSELLSRKLKFPTFLRTVPSDKHQTLGIAKLVDEFNWKSVAIVGSSDEYGKYGSDSLVSYFNDRHICIDFVEILKGDFDQNKTSTREELEDLMGKIANSSAEVIIMFTKDTNVEIIIQEAIKEKLNRTWIASDTWSNSAKVSSLPDIQLAGQVFGFIFKKHEVPGFEDYVTSLFNGTNSTSFQSGITLCPNQSEEDRRKNCSLTNDQMGSGTCLNLSCLTSYIDQDESYSVYLAVNVIVEGLKDLLKCNHQQCQRHSNFTAFELLRAIQKVNFTVDNTQIFFDDHGDPSLGYDIVYWNVSESKQGAKINTIGEYSPNGRISVPEHLNDSMNSVTVTAYNCSKTCDPGFQLKTGNKKCCMECIPCETNHISPGNGAECKSCGEKHYSTDKQVCHKKNDEYLRWSDAFSIILCCSASVGIVVTTVFVVVFGIHFKTPVVKAVGGYLCCVELLSLFAGFSFIFSFMGKPTRESCMVCLPGFGIAFSLCMSCILANLLQIWVAFNFGLTVESWMKKINQPLAVVVTVTGGQVILSVLWLVLEPPYVHEEETDRTILHQCTSDQTFFMSMVAYNAFLGLICFIFAYKGRQLPDLYKNAALITISMLLFLIIWLIFLPLYLTLKGKYTPAIQAAAILISCFSILGCHLAPKCYIMLFRKELNDQNAITDYIKKHYENKGIAVVKS